MTEAETLFVSAITEEERPLAEVNAVPSESEIMRKLKRAAPMPLSERESQVGDITLLGIKQGVIALDLGISVRMAKCAREGLYNKFGVNGRDELIACVEQLNRGLDEKKGRGAL